MRFSNQHSLNSHQNRTLCGSGFQPLWPKDKKRLACDEISQVEAASTSGRDSGFALIITLTLMALVVLVLLSLTIVTRVETTVAGNTVKIDQARENARLALNVAIGELQLHAGADNRITAPANITDTSPPPAQESQHMPNPYWTGVWEPTNPGDPYSQLRLRSWLVSGNSNHTGAIQANEGHITYRANNWNRQGSAAPSDTSISVPWDTNDGVTLVGAGSTRKAESGTNANNVYSRNVRVPLRPITAQRVPGFPAAQERVLGAMAFWVGDEGGKADVSVYDRSGDNVDLGPIDQRLTGLLSSQWTNVRDVNGAFVSNNFENQFAGFSRTPAELMRLVDYNQTVPLMTVPAAGATDRRLNARKERFHDLTTNTRSLFTNPIDSRLRVDLSARSGTSYNFSNFTGGNTLQAGAFPTIFSFLEESNNFVAGPENSPLKPAWTIADSPGRHPVITKSMSSFRFYNEEVAEDQYVLHIDGIFIVELWNPYTHALDLDGVDLEMNFANLPDVTVTTNPPPANPTGVPVSLSGVFDGINFVLSTGRRYIEPGEVLYYRGGGGGAMLVPDLDSLVYTENTGIDTTPTPEPDQPPVRPTVTELSISSSSINVNLSASGVALQSHLNISQGTADVDVPSEDAFQFALYHGLGDEASGTDIFDGIDPRTAPDFDQTANPYLVSRLLTLDDITDFDELPIFGLFAFHSVTPVRNAAFFELPRLEPHSIGGLQHARLTDINITAGVPYALGDPAAVDLNTLFDRAFFSTLPRSPTGHLNRPIQPFPPLVDNPRVEPVYRDDQLPDDGGPDIFDENLAAMDFWAKGGFNVNSTSVEAWVAVLGGVIGTLDFFDGTADSNVGVERGMLRFPQSAGTTATLLSDVVAANTWLQNFDTYDRHIFTRGIRNFTQLQIRLMAQEIVAGVRERGRSNDGPFTSIADFLSWTRTAGGFSGQTVLQAAIERAKLNEIDMAIPDPESGGAEPPRYTPTHITQTDIMSSVGAHWTVRSDTFRIRAYGDKRNPATGEIEARAYCEAIVQRVPDPYLGTGNTDTPANRITPPTPFGRQFRIVSFRWLSADEI